MAKLSIVVSVWNDAVRLARCLASVDWAQELVVVDNSSTDDTLAVAKKFTPKVYQRPNLSMLNVNKNYGFTQASGDWILSLDSDEEVTAALKREIQAALAKKTDLVGYWMPRQNMIFGKWIKHGLWWPDKQLRLFRRGCGKFPCVHVHEYLEVSGPTGQLQEPYIHYNYDSIAQFIRKMEVYTDNEVQKLVATNYQLAWYDALRFPVSDFVKIFFAQAGYKDGLHGLVLSLLQAFYSFVVFAKLWEKQVFAPRDIALQSLVGELNRAGREVRFWSLTAQIKETPGPLGQLLLKLKRRFFAPN